jgi:hypothetical protein
MADNNQKNAPSLELLQAKIAELTAIIGTDYDPTVNETGKTMMEIIRDNDALRTQVQNLAHTPEDAIPDPSEQHTWGAPGKLFYNEGKLISKKHFVDLADGRKLNRKTLDARCQMDHLVDAEGSPIEAAVEALEKWALEHSVIVPKEA